MTNEERQKAKIAHGCLINAKDNLMALRTSGHITNEQYRSVALQLAAASVPLKELIEEPTNTRPVYDPSKTIYTETMNDGGFLTAHILTNTTSINPAHAKPSTLDFFETFDEMHRMVKESYGKSAQYVGKTVFLDEMAHRGMSLSLLEA